MQNQENVEKNSNPQNRDSRNKRKLEHNPKANVRTIYRSDYKVHRSFISEVLCVALAVITTALIWLFSTPM